MSTWSFFDPGTGEFHAMRYSGPESLLHLNAPEGALAVPGSFISGRHRMDVLTGEVLELETSPVEVDVERLAEFTRRQRDLMLSESDWTLLPGSPLSGAKRAEWEVYRDTLRNVPDQPGFPLSIDWPTPPEK